MSVSLKSPAELGKMRTAGRHVAEILQIMAAAVEPGIATRRFDEIAEREIKARALTSAFLNYRGFPSYVCVSVNSVVVHGIPSADVILKEGDIVSLDFGLAYEGYYGDSAITVPVGRIAPEVRKLLKVTEQSLWEGILAAREENTTAGIGKAVQGYVSKHGYGIVRDYVGHGIGRALHEDPSVPNYDPETKGTRLRSGMVLAIEPMINLGGPDTYVEKDGWTVRTKDGSLSAHFEHTVAITPHGPEVLTKL